MRKCAILLVFMGGCDVPPPNEARSGEVVDAYYYPNRSDLTKFEQRGGLSSVSACQEWARAAAERHNDREMRRGDYECGIGYSGMVGTRKVYRTSVK